MTTAKPSLSSRLFAVFSNINEFRSKGGTSSGRAMEELLGQIADIRKNLASAEVVTGTAKKLEDAKALLEKITEAVKSKEDELERVSAQLPDLSVLFSKRADVLAEIELGRAAASDLTAIDKQIDEERKKAEAAWVDGENAMEEIEQLIEGLQRKAVLQEQEIEQLSSELEEVSRQAILRIALDKAELYTKRATEAAQLYREVVTLSEILKAVPWGIHFNSLLGKPFDEGALFPALNAPPFSGECRHGFWTLLDVARMRNYRQPIGKHVPEVASLRKAGAVIPELHDSLVGE